MSTLFARFAKDESGATAVEYGLIVALIAVALITTARLVGLELDRVFRLISGALSTVNVQ
jgi:pilus assembly protein Flp/PilA